MFIGHFALGFAAKKINKTPSLGTMFLAVQWLDLLWPVFLLTGLEEVRIEPGNTEMTPLNFISYPWSHSMLMAISWGALFGLFYFFRTRNRKASFLLFLLVFSHWVLDWLTHRPDLPLAPFSAIKLGLGLWNNKWAALMVELLLFCGCLVVYLGATKPKNKTGTWALRGLAAFLLLIYFMSVFGPVPEKVSMIAWVGLAQLVFVAWGYWIDRNRT